MRLKWCGHACFRLTAQNRFTIVADPYEESVGYRLPPLTAQLVTLSHGHYDHNYAAGVAGHPRVVSAPGPVPAEALAPGVSVYGVPAFHDQERGRRRGGNLLFVYEFDGIRVAHLGDLGHALSQQQLDALGQLDVLLVPVGGYYTIGPEEAAAACNQIRPRLVFPMHYGHPDAKADLRDVLAPVERFLELSPGSERPGTDELELTPGSLREREPWTAVVLNYR